MIVDYKFLGIIVKSSAVVPNLFLFANLKLKKEEIHFPTNDFLEEIFFENHEIWRSTPDFSPNPPWWHA
jgi:hypothetical protein